MEYPVISIRIISSGSIERRPVVLRKASTGSNAVELEMAVDPAQQVICRNVIIKAQVVEELRRSCLTSHLRSILRKSMQRSNHGVRVPTTPG
jgi:hypothetical protein